MNVVRFWHGKALKVIMRVYQMFSVREAKICNSSGLRHIFDISNSVLKPDHDMLTQCIEIVSHAW